MGKHIDALAAEAVRIRENLRSIGIGDRCQIVAPDHPDPVESTAAAMLRKFLRSVLADVRIVPESQADASPAVLLGRESSLSAVRRLCDAGELRIRGLSPQDDGFHIRSAGGNVVIAGANPRGVLYGVYELEDRVRSGIKGPLDILTVPYFQRRSNGVGYYWSAYVNMGSEEFTPEKAEYLSRLRINEYCGCDDGSGFGGHLQELVKSDVFPFLRDPSPVYRRKVRAASEICAQYGIDYYFMIWEPAVARAGAELGQYPPEALGTVRRPWGGDENGLDRTLCVNSPLVQEHYRNLIRKFADEFTHVKGVYFYNMDGNSWLCTPELCPRCGKALEDSPPHIHNPWETQARLVSVLTEAAHAARPDFRFNFWADVHFHEPAVRKLVAGARGYDALSTGWDGSDHDIMVPEDVPAPCAEFLATQDEARTRGVPMYVYFSYNRLESIQQGCPFPFHAARAIRKFKDWGARSLIEVTGPVPALNGVNALVMKAFQSDPDRDIGEFLRDLADRQFGPEAGGLMLDAWKEIEAAFDVWNGYRISPLSGSQPYLSLGTIGRLPNPILPGVEKGYEEDLAIRTRVEPWRAPDYQRFREPRFLEDMERMAGRMDRAASLAAQAAAKASPAEPIGICYYAGSSEGLGRPTRREHARMNADAIAIAANLCRNRAHIVRAVHLINGIEACRASGDAAQADKMRSEYRALVRAHIALEKKLAKLLSGCLGRRPCLPLAGIPEQEIRDFLAGTQGKIGRMKVYLAGDWR